MLTFGEIAGNEAVSIIAADKGKTILAIVAFSNTATPVKTFFRVRNKSDFTSEDFAGILDAINYYNSI